MNFRLVFKCFPFLAVWVIALVLAKPLLSADLRVSCNGSSCAVSPVGGKLFAQEIFIPGQTVTSRLAVTNTGPDDCNLMMRARNVVDSSQLSKVLFTVIKENDVDHYGTRTGNQASEEKTLGDFFSLSWLNLGNLPKNTERNIDWLVTLSNNVGNEYQNLSTKFDVDVNFSCDSQGGNNGDNYSNNNVASGNNSSGGSESVGNVVGGAVLGRGVLSGGNMGRTSFVSEADVLGQQDKLGIAAAVEAHKEEEQLSKKEVFWGQEYLWWLVAVIPLLVWWLLALLKRIRQNRNREGF